MQTLWLDLRHALRLMRQSAAFTTVAVASLALAIGVNTAVFSLLNAVVLRPLPAPHPEQFVAIETVRNGADGPLPFPAFDALREAQSAFSTLVGYFGDGIFNVELNGTLIRGDVWAVTGNFHPELGVTPVAGRLLSDADVNLSTRTPVMVAVLGHGLWQREFGGSTSIVGQTVRVEGVPFTVVGIAPPGFTGFGIVSEPDITIPLTAAPVIMPTAAADRFSGASRWVSTMGRLKTDRTLAAARAEISALWPAVRERTMPPALTGKERDDVLATAIRVTSGATGKEWFLRSRFTGPLYIILGVGALILLIACVNLASLMLSRAAARRHEMSVRLALGASRFRILRQMITEGLLLAAFGGALGSIFATWSSQALATLMTRDYLVPSTLDLSADSRVLAFTTAVAALAGILFSAMPAWRLARQHPAGTLRQHAHTFAAAGRTGRVLIAAQVALSIVLLMDAGLLVRTLQQLRSLDFGFDHANVIMASLFARPDGYRDLNADRYYPELLERIAAIPGVQSAAMTRVRPGFADPKQTIAATESPEASGVPASLGRIGPGFFDVIRMRLESGRPFAWSDDSSARRVAIVSRSLAASLFPGDDAIGRHIRIGATAERRDLEIVGVVSDARLFNPRDPSPASVYVPVLQDGQSSQWSDVVIRTAGGALDAATLRRTVQSLGRESVGSYRPLQQVVDRAILQERVTAIIGGFFGALALALAAIGLYGLMAYGVAERRKEIAIRVALGSSRADVIRMVIRDALTLVCIGLVVGVPAALASGRLIASLLFGLGPSDPMTLIATAMALLAIGAIGGYIPGRRASRIDPAEVLKM